MDAWLCGSRRSILTFTLTCLQFLLILLLLRPHKHHLKWSFLENLRNRDFQDIQEENFLLPCVQKWFTRGWQGSLEFHECPKIRVNVNMKQFSCLHSCNQIVRLAWSLCEAVWWAILDSNLSKIMNTSWTGFLSQPRKHVDGLLLLKQLSSSCGSSQVPCINPHVNICNHRICPSTIHRETDMKQCTSWRTLTLPR